MSIRIIFAAIVLVAHLSSSVSAQDRPLRILVGFPPGTSLDTMARLVGDHLRGTLGQNVVVENRPGVSGQLAAEAVAKSPPDGTLILITPLAPVVTHPHVYSKMRYDAARDLAPLAHIANFEFGFAVPSALNAKTLSEYVELVKRDSKFGSYASAGAGAIPHFFGVLFGRTAKIDIVHIPYKGTGQALPDLISGQISGFIGVVGDVAPLHKTGKARVLATSGKTRHRSLPDVPTFREQGLDIEGFGWYGAYAPAGIASAIADRLSKGVIAALKDPAIAARLDTIGMDITALGAAELAAIQKNDFEKWGPIIRASGFKAE